MICLPKKHRLKWMAALAAVVMLSFLYHWFTVCAGSKYTEALCTAYKKLAVGGSLCEDLCHMRTLRLSACTLNWHSFRVFHTNEFDMKVDSSVFVQSSYLSEISGTFSEPLIGISMTEFTDMLSKRVGEWLGPGEHSDLVDELLKYSDGNKDTKVSLAEAKSLWALMKQREFFMAFVLQHSALGSDMYGFCGNLFATDALPQSPLYSLPATSSWHYPVTAPLKKLFWPDWLVRAKRTISLLEFAADLYGSDESGSFYLCDAGTDMYGINANGDVKLTTWKHVYSSFEIESAIASRTCHVDDDCVIVEPDCRAECDQTLHRCLLPRPSATAICSVLAPYLLPGIPRAVAPDTARLVDRCLALNASAANFSLQHSVISTELKSLLWRYISSSVS